MRNIICLITLALCAATAYAQKITIVVTNVKNANGKIFAGLYNTEDDFMKNRFMSAGEQAKEGEVTLVFNNVPKGEYAISILHDENLNAKMDTKALGIPKEGYGFSNDAMGAFGPPGWDKAKFKFDGKDQTFTVKLKHM